MPEYSEVLRTLHRERADLLKRLEEIQAELDELHVAIRALEKRAGRAGVASERVTRLTSEDEPWEANPFAGMTVREAAAKCLRARGKPMKTAEIADALLVGGLQTKANNFRTTVYSTLSRSDEFEVEDGWWSLVELGDATETGTEEEVDNLFGVRK